MTGRHGPHFWQAGVIAAVLLLSVLAGRQLFQDGIAFVVFSLQDPLWFPQPTPRRFFSVIWSTGLVRLLGQVDSDAIRLGGFLFGFMVFSQVAVPAAVIVSARIGSLAKHLVLAAFLSGALLIANFAVTELLFAYGLTAIFVTLTLDPSRDRKAVIRFVMAILLIASYEIVAVSNLFLALSSATRARRETRPRWSKIALVLVLCAAPPFQVAWYAVNPQPGMGAAKDWLMYPIIGASVLLAGAMLVYFRAVVASVVLRRIGLSVVLLAPLTLLILPDSFGWRSELFLLGYPSRLYTMGMTCFLAMLPTLLDERLTPLPSRLLSGIGEQPIRDLSAAMTAIFCGLSLLASVDAYVYRTRLDAALSEYGGVVALGDCEFCLHPDGAADLSFSWTWPVVGMAHTMLRLDRPPMVVLNDPASKSETYPFSRAEIDAFLRREQGRRVPAGRPSAN